MPVLELDGSNDEILLDGSSLGAIANGPFSMVLIAQPLSLNAFEMFMSVHGSGAHLLGMVDGGSGKINFGSASYYDGYFATGMTAGDWQILSTRKNTGTVAPIQDHKILGSGGWTHGAPGATHAPVATAADLIAIGSRNGIDFKDMRVAAGAVYTDFLTEGEVESIQTTPATQTLIDLGAAAAWNFGEASGIVDLTGNGADEISRVGTTVITDDDPPGWNFGDTPPFVGTVGPLVVTLVDDAGNTVNGTVEVRKRGGGSFASFTDEAATDAVSYPYNSTDGVAVLWLEVGKYEWRATVGANTTDWLPVDVPGVT